MEAGCLNQLPPEVGRLVQSVTLVLPALDHSYLEMEDQHSLTIVVPPSRGYVISGVLIGHQPQSIVTAEDGKVL